MGIGFSEGGHPSDPLRSSRSPHAPAPMIRLADQNTTLRAWPPIDQGASGTRSNVQRADSINEPDRPAPSPADRRLSARPEPGGSAALGPPERPAAWPIFRSVNENRAQVHGHPADSGRSSGGQARSAVSASPSGISRVNGPRRRCALRRRGAARSPPTRRRRPRRRPGPPYSPAGRVPSVTFSVTC